MKKEIIISLLIWVFSILLLITSCDNNTAKPDIYIKGIYLDQETLYMQIDDMKTITAIIIPENAQNKEILWSSSDERVAIVNDLGSITAISNGSTIITATTLNRGLSAFCLVTVISDPIATIIIDLTASDGGSVEGATIVLQNPVGDIYEQSVTSSPIILTNIPFGMYSMVISHSGYHQYIDDKFSVQTHAISHAVQIKNSQIGIILNFGIYNWQVLDIQDNKALILCENILELRLYDSYGLYTWADCSLRTYLNNYFYESNAFFTDEDRARIMQVTNINEPNQWLGESGGENTQDMIFLLSIAEVVKFFGDSGLLENRPYQVYEIDDQYNTNRIATLNELTTGWWLRSPGYDEYLAAYVDLNGIIVMRGREKNYYRGGIRPAMWISM